MQNGKTLMQVDECMKTKEKMPGTPGETGSKGYSASLALTNGKPSVRKHSIEVITLYAIQSY